MEFEYRNQFDQNVIYLHRGISGILRAVRVFKSGGTYWTSDEIPIKANTVAMARWGDVYNANVQYKGAVNGKIKLVLPVGNFDLSRFCHCFWEQGQNAFPCGWVSIDDLLF